MPGKIEPDLGRFNRIIKGKAREDLKNRIGKGEIKFIRGGGGKIRGVSVPVDYIVLPKIQYDRSKKGGVGQGEGDVGTDLGPVNITPGEEKGAGDKPGIDILEVEFSIDEIFKWLMEELELPRIKPKQAANITSDYYRYNGVSPTGPESLRHKKRTYLKALKRMIAAGEYNADNPKVIPIPDDKRYRARKKFEKPENSAVIIHMMDVSGSMIEEDRTTVRTISNLAQILLDHQYNKLDKAYIIHDVRADVVDEVTFYNTHRIGGTFISSAQKKLVELIETKYRPELWNIYPIYFSDGMNWGEDDNICTDILKDDVLPKVNQYSYCQVNMAIGGYYGTIYGEFMKHLEEEFDMEKDPIVWTSIKRGVKDSASILDVIKKFFKPGR